MCCILWSVIWRLFWYLSSKHLARLVAHIQEQVFTCKGKAACSLEKVDTNPVNRMKLITITLIFVLCVHTSRHEIECHRISLSLDFMFFLIFLFLTKQNTHDAIFLFDNIIYMLLFETCKNKMWLMSEHQDYAASTTCLKIFAHNLFFFCFCFCANVL